MVARHARIATGLLLLLLASVTWAQQGPAREPLVRTVVDPPVYMLHMRKGDALQPIALVLRPYVEPGDLSVKLIAVSSGGRMDEEMLKALTPEFKSSNGGLGPMLAIKVDSPLREAATYDVIVRFSHRRASGDPETQDLRLQLIRPEARLRAAPEKLSIDSSYLLPCSLGGWQCGGLTLTRLTLSEETDHSGVASVSAATLSMNGPSEQPVDARFVFPDLARFKIGVGAEEELGYKVEGCFPLGRTSGRIEVRAPELKSPLIIPYEVKARLSSIYIVILLGLGIGSGYWLRIHSEKKLRDGDVDRICSLIADAEQGADEDLSSELKVLEEEITERRKRADVEGLSKLAVEMEQKLEKHLQAFRNRCRAFGQRIEELINLLGKDGGLPAPVSNVLEPLRSGVLETLRFAKAFTEGARPNFKKASEKYEEGEDHLREQLGKTVHEWAKALRAALKMLNEDLQLQQFQPNTRDKLRRGGIEKLERWLDYIEEGLPGEEGLPEKKGLRDKPVDQVAKRLADTQGLVKSVIRDVLRELSHIAARSIELLEELREFVTKTHKLEEESQREDQQAGQERSAEQRRQEWDERERQMQGAIEQVMEAHQKLRALRRSAQTREPEDVMKEVIEQVLKLPTIIRKATVQAANPEQEPEKHFNRALKTGGLIYAVHQYRMSRGLPPIGLHAGLAAPPSAASTKEAASGRAPPSTEAGQGPSPREKTEEKRAADQRRLKRNQKVVAAIIIGAVSFFLFKDTFTGTPQECITIFGWGFGLDIGVAGVSQVLGALKPSKP